MNNEGTLADVRCVTNLLYITHFQPTVYIDYQLLRVLSIQILLTSSIHVTKAATITCDHLYCIPVPQSTFLQSTTILLATQHTGPGCTPAPAGWILIRLAFHHRCVAGASRCLIIIIIAFNSSVQLSVLGFQISTS